MTAMIAWDWPNTPITILAVIVVTAIVRWIAVMAIRRWAKVSGKAGRRIKASLAAANAETIAGVAAATGNAIGQVMGMNSPRRLQRMRTAASLLVNIVNAAAVIICVLTILSVLGIPMGPVLAGAGIGGVAIGFGAQSLVKDVISGLFMIAEDQYGVGDLINVGNLEGTVEEVGLRVTRIRKWSGEVWYIRNGEITQLGNQSQGWSTGVIEVPTHISADPDQVIATLEATAREFWDDPAWRPTLNEPPAVWGLDSLNEQTMVFKLAVKTPTNQQSGPQRALRSRCLIALKKAGIRSPGLLVTAVDQARP